MGRIKSALIKRTAEKLMAKQEFKTTFEENKGTIRGLMPSKRLQNMIAGYITKKVRAKSESK
jgi:ribosomal protein S17E